MGFSGKANVQLVPKLQLGNALVPEALLRDARRMRSRYHARESDRGYFVTATVVEWLPVFVSTACCDLVVRSLEYCLP